ncbi:MAG: ArsR/SmtB family transcription factor [Solirubrobacterales bacterium]
MDSVPKRLQQLLAAVGEPSRFRIVLELARRERHVSDLAEAIGLSQSCTTRHLQALERAGAVQTRRFGKRVVASLALQSVEVSRLLQWLGVGTELDVDARPGRTGGTEARSKLPQEAPPRLVRRSPRSARSANRVGPSVLQAPSTASRAEPGTAREAGHEDRPHAGPGASDTPPVADPEQPRSPRPRRPDLEDFLL